MAEAPESGFLNLLGIEFIEQTEELARGRIAVAPNLLQQHGLVHGGVIASLAETLASKATNDVVSLEGMAAMGQSNLVTFLRPITEGHVNGEARVVHRGRTTWIWDVEVTDDEGRRCALVRMTVAVRPRR